ncbi:armadillo repeat-containing protein 7-like isoform X2 [Tubulanus polymorphus]|uniref:armadillo repeat-containing protein 7-like isoform X2 n=1 Tax=Tubulanus polymorphus TaxID=672921 RepID=UPI003DA5EF61
MYYSKDYLEKKTGPHGIGRPNYLKSLVDEFRSCHDQKDSRRQVLANLANFAYDPINYDYMRRLNVIQIFIDTLDAEDEKLIEFAMAGLCNLSLDKDNKLLILNKDAIQKITTCLSNSNVETVLNAISTLMFLVTAESKAVLPTLIDRGG